MSQNKITLTEHYRLKDSIKDYKGYKVKSPDVTLKNINHAFDKIDLKTEYIPKENNLLRKFYPYKTGFSVLKPKSNDEIILLRSGGKGVTPILANASASAELIERFTGYGLLGGGNIHFYLAKIKRNQIWKNKNINPLIDTSFDFHLLDIEDLLPSGGKTVLNDMTKSICYSLTNDKFYSYPEEFILSLEGSNGLASGNTLEEAILHALYEVIERLVGFYVLDNLPNAKKISKDSITHPTILKMMEAIESLGFFYELLDFSNVFGIPVIYAVFDHPDWNMEPNPYTKLLVQYPKISIGVDTNPQDAAMRCFTEFIQVAEPLHRAYYNEIETYEQFKMSNIKIDDKQNQFLKTGSSAFTNGNVPLSFDLRKYVKRCTETILIESITDLYDVNQKNEIEKVVQLLKHHDIEVLTHDITHPILDFPVARILISGGKNYFSQLPFNGYAKLILNKQGKKERFSFLNYFINTIIGPNEFDKLITSEEWIKGKDIDKLITLVTADLCYKGTAPGIWGLPVNKFYLLGMLYLKTKNVEMAENCFNAALCQNPNDIAPLLGIAYLYRNKKMGVEFENIMYHISLVNKDNLNIEKELEEFDKPVIEPNPFEPCDFKCKERNKPHLCEKCFFGYVSEDVFMRQKTDIK